MIELGNFVRFCKMQLATGDYDAHIPFLTNLATHLGYGKEVSVWLGFLYMGYYSEASAYCAISIPKVKAKKVLPPGHYPITTQRRNLYGGRIHRHFADLYTRGPLYPWLVRSDTWLSLMDKVSSVWGNGRWATYTTSELITHLGGLRIEPSSFEILESSGPRKGLVALGLEPTEASAVKVSQVLARNGLQVPTSVLESLLCDWAGMNKGTFYAGRNIDRQQGRILACEAILGVRLDVLWNVRKRVFPRNTLGELNGWQGINKQRLKVYRDLGTILKPEEER